MKNLLVVLILVVMLLSTCAKPVFNEEATGDMNNDESISITDYTLMRLAVKHGDVNHDGKLDEKDLEIVRDIIWEK